MKKFVDAMSREWSLVVNVGTAKKVKDLTGIDIFNIYTEKGRELFSDPISLVNVLYVLCESQCKERGVTEEGFGEGLYGDPIEAASMALLTEVAGFFPSDRRQVALKMLEKSTTAAKTLMNQALTELEAIDATQINFSKPTKPLES